MGISRSPVGTDGQMIVFVDIERDALGTLLQCQRLDVLQNFLPQSEALKLLLNINFFKVNFLRRQGKLPAFKKEMWCRLLVLRKFNLMFVPLQLPPEKLCELLLVS